MAKYSVTETSVLYISCKSSTGCCLFEMHERMSLVHFSNYDRLALIDVHNPTTMDRHIDVHVSCAGNVHFYTQILPIWRHILCLLA